MILCRQASGGVRTRPDERGRSHAFASVLTGPSKGSKDVVKDQGRAGTATSGLPFGNY